MSTLPALLILFACSSNDPARNEAATYINAIQPLLVENRALAELQLDLASVVYNSKDVPIDDVLKRWNTETVPLSRHLHQQADLVDVPDGWKDDHAALIMIWTDRTHAFSGMGEALLLSDDDRWKTARALQDTVIRREEAWFDKMDARVTPLDLQLKQHP